MLIVSLNYHAVYDDDDHNADYQYDYDDDDDGDHLCHYVLALFCVLLRSGCQLCLVIKYHCHIASFAWISLSLNGQQTLYSASWCGNILGKN